MAKYNSTILSMSIHPETESAFFGERATHIALEDDGGGVFLKITQCPDTPVNGEVRLEREELDIVHREAMGMFVLHKLNSSKIEFVDDESTVTVSKLDVQSIINRLDVMAKLGNGDHYGNSHGNAAAKSVMDDLVALVNKND